MKIKYRIWDKTNKYWLDYDEIFINQEGEVYEIEERNWAYQTYMHQENITDKVEITQYTGLKDKNGKEIYEGDIVANLRGKRSEINWCNEEFGWVAESKYPNGKDSTITLADLNSVATIEVIGNIFES